MIFFFSAPSSEVYSVFNVLFIFMRVDNSFVSYEKKFIFLRVGKRSLNDFCLCISTAHLIIYCLIRPIYAINLGCPFYFSDVPTAVQVESLHCFAHLCFESEVRLQVQPFVEFPSILVPLASYDQVFVWCFLLSALLAVLLRILT